MADVKLKRLDPLLKKLARIGKLEGAAPAIQAAGLHIKGAIAEYPPASEANSPSNQRWYERGYGSRWRRKDGTIGGRATSETLGRRWTVESEANGLRAVVGNNASYGPYVQSAERQARFHSARGWKTDAQVIEEESETVLEFVQDAVRELLES